MADLVGDGFERGLEDLVLRLRLVRLDDDLVLSLRVVGEGLGEREAIGIGVVQGLEDVVGDSRADHLQQDGRRHREPEHEDRLVRFFDAVPVLERIEDDTHLAREDAVDDEAGRVPDEDRALAQLFGEGPGRRESRVVRVGGADELHERQDRDGVEEVDADVCAHLGDRKAGGVRGEDAVVPRVLAQLGEDSLLRLELLEDGLQDEIAVGEVLVGRSGRDDRAEEARLALVVAALRDLLCKLGLDRLAGAVEGFLADVAHSDRHLEAAEDERRDLGGHQARADDPDLADRPRLLRGPAGRALRAALDEVEGVERCLGLAAGEQLADGLFLGAKAFLERPAGASTLDQLERLVRSGRGAVHLSVEPGARLPYHFRDVFVRVAATVTRP